MTVVHHLCGFRTIAEIFTKIVLFLTTPIFTPCYIYTWGINVSAVQFVKCASESLGRRKKNASNNRGNRAAAVICPQLFLLLLLGWELSFPLMFLKTVCPWCLNPGKQWGEWCEESFYVFVSESQSEIIFSNIRLVKPVLRYAEIQY